MLLKETNIKKELFYCFISGTLSFITVYIFLGLHGLDLNVPFQYWGDAFGGLTAAQNFITGNGRYLFPNMGAPGVVSNINIPDTTSIHYFGMWILSLFIKEAGLLVNILYIFSFIAIAISATISLRLLNIGSITSVIGGVLYSLLPYHFTRGTGHLFLSTYFIIPFACVIILWLMNGEIIFNKPDLNIKKIYKKILSIFPIKTIFAIIFTILIGMDNIYYAIFALLGITFSILWNQLNNFNINRLLFSLIILAILILTLMINLIPFIFSIFSGIDSGLEGSREIRDVEFYSLKFSQLVLPNRSHRIPLLAEIRNYYDNIISISNNENSNSTLGMFISIGLIMSLFIAMRYKVKNNINYYIKNSAILNVFMIILGSVGGISSIISFFISSLRCYNRLSIYIAFYSLFIVIYFIEYLLQKCKITNYIKYIIILFIGILAILDITVPSNKDNTNTKVKYYSDKSFVKKIEDITPENSMIFQLPFVPSRHHAHFVNMGVYQQFTPFVHSNTLKWSYRATSNSIAERWQSYVASKPADEMLKHLAGVGFNGLYIDKNGYSTSDEYNIIRNKIIEITGVEPIVSNNGRLEYFLLTEYFLDLVKTFNQQEVKIYSNWNKIIITDFNKSLNVSNKFDETLLSGWNAIEPWGVWSQGKTSNICFVILEKTDLTLRFDFDLFPSPTRFNVEVNGFKIESYESIGRCEIIIPVKKEYLTEKDGEFPVNIQFNIENPLSPSRDKRIIGIGLKNYVIRKGSYLDELEKITDYNMILNVSNNFNNTLISGWNIMEPWGVWSQGKTSKISFVILEKRDLVLRFYFDLFPNPTRFNVEVNGIKLESYERVGRCEVIVSIKEEYLTEESGVFPVNIQFNIENPLSPGGGDPRIIGIGLKNYTISTGIYSYVNNLKRVTDFNKVLNVSNDFDNTLISGWNIMEPWGVWSQGKTSKISFVILEKRDLVLHFNFDLFPNPTKFNVEVNGIKLESYEKVGRCEVIVFVKKEYLTEESGVFPVNIQFNIENPLNPGGGDSRIIGIGLTNYIINVEK